MPVTYEPCEEDEYAILDRLIRQYRDDLVEANARIAMFFVLDTEYPNTHALMVRGKPAQGSAKVNSVGDRAEGKADATIRLDWSTWRELTLRQRTALVHHELSHIGCPNPKKTDSLGRPVLKPVHADWETDGFDEVIQIYGESAPEKINLNIIRERLRVQGLKFGDEDETETTIDITPPTEAASGVSAVEVQMGSTSVTLTPEHFKNLKTATAKLRAQADRDSPEHADAVKKAMIEVVRQSETPEPLDDDPADRWRNVPIVTVTRRLSPDAMTVLLDNYELRTLGDVADFLAGGERLHELPLLNLDDAAKLAEDIDIYRCDQGGEVAAGIHAEWLADTLKVYRDNAIESAKVKNPPKSKSKAKAQATA